MFNNYKNNYINSYSLILWRLYSYTILLYAFLFKYNVFYHFSNFGILLSSEILNNKIRKSSLISF